MVVYYSPEQRLAIVKLRYKHDNEYDASIMDRYNDLEISKIHPMIQGREDKQIIDKFGKTFTLLDVRQW